MGFRTSTRTDRAFIVSIILKALDGLLEIIGGILLFFIRPESITHWVTTLTQHELSQDSNDIIATHLLHSARHLTAATTLFAAVYLLSHGITKVVLVIEILRDHLWAFKGMI